MQIDASISSILLPSSVPLRRLMPPKSISACSLFYLHKTAMPCTHCYWIQAAERLSFQHAPFLALLSWLLLFFLLGIIGQPYRSITEFGPPIWQAEADKELTLSTLPATRSGPNSVSNGNYWVMFVRAKNCLQNIIAFKTFESYFSTNRSCFTLTYPSSFRSLDSKEPKN